MEAINDRSGMMDVISKSNHHQPDNDTDDDDDDALHGGGTTTETTTTCEPDLTDTAGLPHHCGGGGRDEVGEVRKMSSKDTKRLRLWRIVVTGVLLLTAFAVTFTTYTLLKQQEEENFHTAVRYYVMGVVGHSSVIYSIYIYIYLCSSALTHNYPPSIVSHSHF
jgi:hypothetical protein